MSVPLSVRTQGGAFDVLFKTSAASMGFITREPAQKGQVSNVAPRIRVGGDAAYNTDAFDQIVFPGFDTGGDKEVFETDERRYQWSDGKVSLEVRDRITLASQWAVEDASVTPTARQIIDFMSPNGDYIALGAGTTLRKYDDASGLWSNEGSFGADASYIWANDTYLFVACGTGDDAWRWDGTPSSGWTQLTGIKANCFGWFGAKLWRAYGNEIFEANAASGNDGTGWESGISVGFPSTDILDIVEDSAYLYIAKPEGLFVYDGTAVYRLIDAVETRSTINFRGFKPWQGVLYLPWLARVKKAVVRTVTSLTATDITPTMVGSEARERYGHGFPVRLFAGPNGIYGAFNAGEGVYPELLAHNEVGWHQIYRGASGDTLHAAGFSRLKDWLIVNDGSTRRKRITNSGSRVYPDYNETGEFWTPAVDGGYPDELKSWRDFTITLESGDADNYVTVYYRADGGSWVEIGSVTVEGQTTLLIGKIDAQVSARSMEFRLVLTRDAADITATPRIKLPIVVRAQVAPAAIDGFDERLVLDTAEPLRNGFGTVGEVYSFQEMRDFLDMLADTPETITRVDELGGISRVKVLNKSEMVERLKDETRRSAVANLKMQSMYSGLYRQVDLDVVAAIDATATLFEWSGSSAYGTRRYGLFRYGA